MSSYSTRHWMPQFPAALGLFVLTAVALGAQEVAIAPEQPAWTGHAVAFQPAEGSEDEAFLAVWGTEWQLSDQEEFGVYARLVRYPGTLGGIVPLFPQQIADDPAMAFGTARRQYLVTWAQQTEDLSSTWLWGTILDESPEDQTDIVCGPFVVQEYGDYGAIDEMSVAYNGDTDDWMVIWEGRVDLSARGLYGRRVFGCGDVGPLLQIDEGSFAEAPSLSYNPETEHYLAVWQSPDGMEILGRVLGLAGDAIGPVFTIASCDVDCGSEDDQMGSAWAVWEPESSRWLVLWSEICARPEFDSTCEDFTRVYARFVVDGGCDAPGGEEILEPEVCLENPLQVSSAAGASLGSAAAFNPPTQDFLSAWTRFNGADPDDVDVYGRWLTNQGTGGLEGGLIALHADPATEEKTPEAAGHVACSLTRPYCLVVLNEYVLAGAPGGLDFTANIVGVFVGQTSACSLATTELWPPNHKLVDVGLSVPVSGVCDDLPPTIAVTVTSDEHAASAWESGGSPKCPDALVGDDGSVQLRAERFGTGDGRVYRIAAATTDSCGNVETCEATVAVPHDRGEQGAAVDSGQIFDATVCN